MAYVGRPAPQFQFDALIKDTFSGNGSTTDFTLSKSPASVNSLLVIVDNVLQEPATAFSISDTTLSFTEAPSSGSKNIYACFWGGTLGITTAVKLNTSNVAAITGNVTPASNVAFSLGQPANAWKELWLDGNSLHLGNTSVSIGKTGEVEFMKTNKLGQPVTSVDVANVHASIDAGGVLSFYSANTTGNVRFARGAAIGYANSKVPGANLDVKGNTYISGKLSSTSQTPAFYGANVTGNASVTRSLAVGYTDGRVPQANLDVKGNTYISSNVSLGSSINFLDSSSGEIGKAVFGSPGKDLEIYHNGSHSFIADVGAGQLYLDGSAINLTNSLFTEHYMYMAADAQVQLYYDNSKKFETTSTGVEISGHTKAYQFGTSTGHSLSDDAVLTITNVPIEYGLILIHSVSTDFGIVGFRAQSGAAETYLDFNSSGRIAVTTGILTGTTGTDGKLNISAATNTNLYIENRLGGGTTVGYTLIG